MTAALVEMKREKLRRIYQRDPYLYARQVLGVVWWEKQVEIAKALLTHKRVLVRASHAIGKSHCAAGLINWHFDCFNPGETLVTAPTFQQVVDVLFKEVRRQRGNRPGLMPKHPRMETSADHYAVGYTAFSSDAFQGRHSANILIVFDEAVGVDTEFREGAEGMLTGDNNCLFLGIYNPTDTSSWVYEAEQSGMYHVISVSALDHPNIVAELEKLPPPYPSAVRLQWVLDRLQEWCDPIGEGDRKEGDIEFPPDSGKWYRPGPLFESRVLGRWPSQGSYSVWSENLWQNCLIPQPIRYAAKVVIGCDVARFGDDMTSILVIWGNCAIHHEYHNGWSTQQTADRLKELCIQFHADFQRPEEVEVRVDDDGVGGGVIDQRGGFKFLGVSGARSALSDDFPNWRSQAWFDVADRARAGKIDLSRLSKDSQNLLRQQLFAPTYRLDGAGRRVVEKKEDTKKRLKRSPDDADALNLAFSTLYGGVEHLPTPLTLRDEDV